MVAISTRVRWFRSVFSRLVTRASAVSRLVSTLTPVLNCITTDDETIFLMLNTLWRCIDDNIDLVAKDQVHQVRRRLLQFIGACYLDSVLSQDICCTSCCEDTVSLSSKRFAIG